MISKELFVRYITEYQKFNKAIDRFEEAISGRKFGVNLYETDWCNSVGLMFDTFLQSHFTEYGCDLINAFVFEDCRDFWIYKDKTFEDKKKEHYKFNTLEELYDALTKFKKDYFL